jgi:hypothetical protein
MFDSGETSEPPQEHAPNRYARLWSDPQWRVLAAVLAVVAAVAIAAPYLPGKVGVIAASGPGLQAAGKPSAPGAAAAKSRPSTAKPIPPTPEQLATSTRVPAKLAAALRTWSSTPAGTAFSEVRNEVGFALQSGGFKSYAVMRSACVSVGTSVNAAAARQPIPDAAMQSQYRAALSVLTKAASDCRSAISVQKTDESVRTEENSAALHLAQSELGTGVKSLAAIALVISEATAAG